MLPRLRTASIIAARSSAIQPPCAGVAGALPALHPLLLPPGLPGVTGTLVVPLSLAPPLVTASCAPPELDPPLEPPEPPPSAPLEEAPLEDAPLEDAPLEDAPLEEPPASAPLLPPLLVPASVPAGWGSVQWPISP